MARRIESWWGVTEQLSPWLTGLCAIHCLALPVAMALTTSMTVGLLSWKHPLHGYATFLLHLSRWEATWVGVGLLVTLASLLHGFRRHRRPAPVAWLLASVAVFALALAPIPMDAWTHAVLMTIGSAILMAATFYDRRLRRMH